MAADDNYFEDEVFTKKDFTSNPLPKGEYEFCRFLNCDFSNSHLSNYIFTECVFENCNLSMAQVRNTSLKDARFNNCKILGVNFSECNPFLLELAFSGCNLNNSSFYILILKNIAFIDCSLEEVDFVESDLSKSVFENCSLRGAVFENSNLERADFRTATGFTINPEINKLKKAWFSQDGLIGLLRKYEIEVE